MKSRLNLILKLICYLLFSLGIGQASATLYCNRAYSELTMNPGKPYNAVGFLNNGCTAFLIDQNHIAAAAHCFVNPVTGAWQTGLRFYPNFHPDRVSADEKHVPRSDVIRAVVGTRGGETRLGSGADWGIARVDNWQDTGGMDLTPIQLAPSMPSAGTALFNPAYTRHHFPYNDSNAVTWDNMEWDDKNPGCGWVNESAPGKNDGGMWAMLMRTTPIFDGVHRDKVGCNSRWMAGTKHANCSLARLDNDVVVHNCDTIGGSSGSPIIYEYSKCLLSLWGSCLLRAWWDKTPLVIGVGHGGGSPATAGSNDFSQKVPTCSQDIPANRDNVAASVSRFREAPRFAANVAIHRYPGNPWATTVYAIDSDLNRVVYRSRISGAAGNYSNKFSYWQSLDAPNTTGHLNRIASCEADTGGTPQIFVVLDNKKIYTRSGRPTGGWNSWTSFTAPDSTSSAIDIDAARDNSGRCQLFTVTDKGDVYTRMKTTASSWGNWNKLAAGTYRKLTALKYNGQLWLAMIDVNGDISRLSHSQSGWSGVSKLPRPAGIVWRDIDMTWDEHARGFMLALPTNPGNKLYFMPMYGNQAWSQWRYFDTHLWTPHPKGGTQNAPELQSITASRWMEDAPGTTSPLVFATDKSGNVYFIEYTRVGAPRWVLDWKSFYHESILY